ncbi:MAG: twin-arginine translocase subunit TatC [Planctomycetaceae bacterium]|jgi:sec-independent protein translocase protein TatC|nr:twin-arginine translocase subunit TatC [Planctomycetaceae bacterium]
MSSKNAKDKDLFQDSTMSFSQHLDELRTCLMHAFKWLAIGVIAGFFFGNWAVRFINQPLEKSLQTFYEEQAKVKIAEKASELRETGYADSLAGYIEQGYIFEETYVIPNDVMRILTYGTASPTSAGTNRQMPFLSVSAVDNFNDYKRTGSPPLKIFLMKKSADDPRVRIKALSAQETFSLYIKASFVLGLLFSSPGIFWSVWSFVAAGLYPHERRYVYYFMPISLGLFISGMLLAFLVVFQYVLDFLFFFNRYLGIDPDPRVSEWVKFALLLPVGFGVSFQLPLVMFFLERIGIFSIKTYISKWRISVFAIVVLSMFLTPGDPYSMLLMSVPLVILYFGGVMMCKIFPRKEGIFDFDKQDIVPV